VDRFHLGIRSNRAEVDARLQHALAARFVPDVIAPANYSVRLATGDEKHRRGAGFHFLYRGSAAMVRTRDPRRVVNGLCSHLASFEPTYGAGLLEVNGLALVGGRAALVAPAPLRQWMPQMERRLNVRGLHVVDMPWTLLDPATAEVVVPDPADVGLDIPRDAFAGLDDEGGATRSDPYVTAGRYPLRSWAFLGDAAPLSRARAVANAMPLTSNRDGLQANLDALADVMRAITPVTVEWEEPAKLAAALADLLE
jgi:hypothetical protein